MYSEGLRPPWNQEKYLVRECVMKKNLVIWAVTIILVPLIHGGVWAGDMDDGISKFTDDGVDKYDEMGKPDQNIKFIVMNAKSKAAMMQNSKSGDNLSGGDSTSAMNSVILGAGSKVKGDIYIIDQSKGSKTNVGK